MRQAWYSNALRKTRPCPPISTRFGAKAKPTRFRARHGLGYTILENTTDGVAASFRVFVPAGDEPAEYWTLRLAPERARDLTVFVYEQISFKYMWGFNSYGDMFYRNSRLDAKRNMAIFTKHPFVTPHPWQTGYLAADQKIDGFDGSKDFFVGTYNQLNEPEAVVKGRCTGSVGSSDATIAALQFDLGRVKAGVTRASEPSVPRRSVSRTSLGISCPNPQACARRYSRVAEEWNTWW